MSREPTTKAGRRIVRNDDIHWDDVVEAEAEADRFANFPTPPKRPEECKRHRWTQMLNLRTGEFIPGRYACWHCGRPRKP